MKWKLNTTCLIAGQLNEHVLISCNPRTRYMCNKTYLLSEFVIAAFYQPPPLVKQKGFIKVYSR